MQKWEYLQVNKPNPQEVVLNEVRQKDDTRLPMLFNRLGEQGWELVAVTDAYFYHFKRPKQ